MSAPLLPSKRDVRRSFDAAARTYDEHAFLQREIADRLFERLEYIKLAPQCVIDLGCGTGYSSRKLQARFPQATLVSVDLAPAMLEAARSHTGAMAALVRWLRRGPAPRYLCADIESLPLADESADLALSNLALQWCDPQQVAREAARVIRPEGLFMFTTFGPDTLKELRTAFRGLDERPHVNQFVDMHDIGDMLVEAGFADPVMDQETITLTYSDLKPLLRELKGIGAHNVLPGRSTGLMGRARWQRMVTGYEQFRRDGRLPATYEVVYGHAWKPAIGKRKTIDGQQKIDLKEFERMVRGKA
ncbi:MAG: malonyl-ACP O-methyltransferase BioC [Betaproteobacteria bacterium]|nr:malonyl-ACP O-methyltransferase BioC [Betaproteobacteria bacterium]